MSIAAAELRCFFALIPDLFPQFRSALAVWYASAKRDLPWRQTRDPYAILISEIMLQQTRVAAVIPYYLKFLDRFPTASSLAKAGDDELLSAWAGLGYYRRAKNLRAAATRIVTEGFPATYEALRSLPGVGDYTAAAVASIAFGQPHAVVDGNLLRVLARLWNDPADVASGSARRVFQSRADALLDRSDPATHNQAAMELGATLCLPKTPHCLVCPVSPYCQAREAGTQDQLPYSSRTTNYVNLRIEIAVIMERGRVLLWQRTGGSGVMPGFYELPETSSLEGLKVELVLGEVKHAIMNQRIRARVVQATRLTEPPGEGWLLATADDLRSLPLSSLTRKALGLADTAGIITFAAEA